MESRKSELSPLPPPPGVLNALVNGFNATAGNVVVVLFPAVLDMFLWLGPRLKVDALLAPIMEVLPEIQAQAPAEQAKLFMQIVTDFQSGFNLFSVFRTFPMGIFSLMSVNLSNLSPLGTRSTLDVPGWLAAFALVLALTFFGWLLGSLYFRAVARIALKLEAGPGIFRSLLHGVLLSGVWMLLLSLANLPLIILLWVLTLLDGVIRTILLILLVVPVSWALLAIFFSFYGIFVSAQNAFVSTRNSIRMLRYGLVPLGWFVMVALIVNQGMDSLWHVPPPESWMTAVGIFGHAFVSTSLLAASFIYYRDLNAWIDSALQWLQKQKPSSAQA